jgi:hypothetical protein
MKRDTRALVSLVEAYLRATSLPYKRLCIDERYGTVDDLGGYASLDEALEACRGDFEALEPKHRSVCFEQTEFIVGPLQVERVVTWAWDDDHRRVAVVMRVSTASS